MNKKEFGKKLRLLHGIGNELSMSKSVNDLCRSMVFYSRSRLGFDRLSTWFLDSNPKFLIGSFGVDEEGRLREETRQRIKVEGDPTLRKIHIKKKLSVLRTGAPLRDNSGNIVGRGSHLVAAIWNGKKAIGYIFTDNLLNKKPFTQYDRELLELFASTFGHLYSLKRTEEALKAAFERLKEAQSKLIQSAKMEVVGSLASGVAHEVKNPLAVIIQGLYYMSKKVPASDRNLHDVIKRMNNSVKKADDIIKGILDFSVITKPEFIPQDIHSIIEKSLRLLSYEIDKFRIAIHRRFEKGLPDVKIDKNKVEQVLVNILLNAINGMHEGGQIRIRTYSKGHGRARKVLVEIEDTGPGIPADIIDRVFDPFFTTRRSTGGTGLGLTIARNIMDMHKAKISLENKKAGRGLVVTMAFRI
jgi:signal transduction histidine kinase